MTLALTKVQVYGIESEEPLNKRYRQYMYLTGTAANTDTAFDLGAFTSGSLGTFWTAVSGTSPGSGALVAIQDIYTRSQFFGVLGGDFMTRAEIDSSRTVVQSLTSAVYAGGSATPTLAVTGLLTTDTILGATQIAKNANSLPLIGANATCATNDQYPVIYSADPGNTGTVRVTFSRTVTTPDAGTYQITYTNRTPNITFASGDAPTTWNISLSWILLPNVGPVEYYAST